MNPVTVRDGKGQKDRVTMLPSVAKELLAEHRVHQQGLRQGLGGVYLPDTLARNYPNAEYVFPAACLSINPRSGGKQRHHLDEPSSTGRSGRWSANPV